MTIGVASVIVLIAVGNGSSKAVQSRIQSLGTNVLIVQAQRRLRGGARARASVEQHRRSTKKDAEALQNPGLAPDVKSASPVVNASEREARQRQHELRAVVVRRHDAVLPDGAQLHGRRKARSFTARRRRASTSASW